MIKTFQVIIYSLVVGKIAQVAQLIVIVFTGQLRHSGQQYRNIWHSAGNESERKHLQWNV